VRDRRACEDRQDGAEIETQENAERDGIGRDGKVANIRHPLSERKVLTAASALAQRTQQRCEAQTDELD
jgi:hypothetical protein